MLSAALALVVKKKPAPRGHGVAQVNHRTAARVRERAPMIGEKDFGELISGDDFGDLITTGPRMRLTELR